MNSFVGWASLPTIKVNKGLKMIKFDKNIKFGGQGCPPYDAKHRAHFEAYDKPVNQGGKVIENTSVSIIKD